MNIIKPTVSLESNIDGRAIIKKIEKAGRKCYKSETRITNDSASTFIKNIIKRGHFSVLEHHSITADIICDRGISHEIVRHRLASYSMESTRYVNYQGGMDFIEPIFWVNDSAKMEIWRTTMIAAEKRYQSLMGLLSKPEEARSVLPMSLKTELAMTCNLREWRHFMWLRGNKNAHIQVREIAAMILRALQNEIPIVFDDFKINDKELLITTDVLPAS